MTEPGLPPAHRFTTADLIAGISVALVLIPQSLAYAEIAGVPSYVGLYAAALPPLAAAAFASSRYLQTGPVAMTALLAYGALTPLAAAQSDDYVKLAALLALVVGVARVLLGVVRAGVVAYFMSQPVLAGFTSAAAILILGSQLPTALGTTGEGGTILARAWSALSDPGGWEVTSIALSVVTIALVLGSRRIHPLFPGVLAAVLIGIGYSLAFSYPGPVVGDVPRGLPPFSLDLPWGDLGALIIPGIVIALVGFAEPAAIARTFAAQDREAWDPDREFISQGIANLAAGVSGAFPVGGSFSRSSVNRIAGGKTKWAGAVTGAVVLAFLPVASILEPLPRAILGAIVVAAVAKLIRIPSLVAIARYSIPQGTVALTTFVATLVLAPRIERAVIIGIGLGIVIHLVRELRTEVDAVAAGTELRISPIGVLYFGSAPSIEAAFLEQLSAHPDARTLVMDLRRLGRIDYTGALALKALADEAVGAGLEVVFDAVPPQSRRLLDRVWEGELPAASP